MSFPTKTGVTVICSSKGTWNFSKPRNAETEAAVKAAVHMGKMARSASCPTTGTSMAKKMAAKGVRNRPAKKYVCHLLWKSVFLPDGKQ